MSDFIPYIVFGIATGSIYGLAAMGLVLTYKTSGVFNFGHGAIGAASAYFFYFLRQEHGVPWPVAALIAIGLLGILMGLILERFAAALASVATAKKVIATIGLLVMIRSLALLAYPGADPTFHTFFPQEKAFSISGVPVTYDNVITTLLAASAALGLFLLFRGTRIGRSMRALVDDPMLLNMTGENPTRVRQTAWIIGATFASASGVLFASVQQQLDATLLPLLVVQAFGAAAIGAFTNLPMAYAGGLAIGVLQKVVSKEASVHTSLSGLDVNIPFIVLFIALLVLGKGRLTEFGRQVKAPALPSSSLSPTARRGIALGAAAFFALVPFFVGTHLPLWVNAASQLVIFLSLGLLVNTSGQISLCHVGFAAIGGAAFGHLLGNGFPWGVALLVAGFITIPVGALIAIPAVRLSGLFLALATLGFGVFLAQFFYLKSYFFGLDAVRTGRPNVSFLQSDRGYYYLLIGVAALAMVLVTLVERSRLGRFLRALADSPTALTTLGGSATVCRVLVFCISSFMAGIGGALFAGRFQTVNLSGYPYINSLLFLAVLVIGGRRTIPAAVAGSLLLFVVPGYIDSYSVNQLLQAGFGLAAIVLSMTSGRGAARPTSLDAEQAVHEVERDSLRLAPSSERHISPGVDRLQLLTSVSAT